MAMFGLSAIPPAVLERITVPTALIWARHDRAIPLAVAEAASERYGGRCMLSRKPRTILRSSNGQGTDMRGVQDELA
jgi:pimeloyl-ACP methyl ester carboxylesterase